jgi:hypothetical protein
VTATCSVVRSTTIWTNAQKGCAGVCTGTLFLPRDPDLNFTRPTSTSPGHMTSTSPGQHQLHQANINFTKPTSTSPGQLQLHQAT